MPKIGTDWFGLRHQRIGEYRKGYKDGEYDSNHPGNDLARVLITGGGLLESSDYGRGHEDGVNGRQYDDSYIYDDESGASEDGEGDSRPDGDSGGDEPSGGSGYSGYSDNSSSSSSSSDTPLKDMMLLGHYGMNASAAGMFLGSGGICGALIWHMVDFPMDTDNLLWFPISVISGLLALMGLLSGVGSIRVITQEESDERSKKRAKLNTVAIAVLTGFILIKIWGSW
jgi:hypothetical protein